MNVNQTICDECKRTKQSANHWHQLMVWNHQEGVTVAAGNFRFLDDKGKFEIHDLCGEQCLWKHIGKLLKINPSRAPEDEAVL